MQMLMLHFTAAGKMTQTFRPGNGTTGRTDMSTGGGFPGAWLAWGNTMDNKMQAKMRRWESRRVWDSWGCRRVVGDRHGLTRRDRGCTRQSSTMNGKRLGGSRSSPARSPPGCPHSLRRTGAVKLECRINLGINNVRADGVINTRVRQPYRPTSNTFGGARRHTGLSWFRPFRRSVPQPYPRGWTRIQTRLTRSGLRRRQRRYKAVCPVFFLPLKPHTYIWLKTVLNVVDITSKRRRRV
jgi:hypothetical protein